MTQPVQEPNQGRINQGVAFKQRQLFRRPVPVVTTGGQWAYLQRITDQTVGAGSSEFVEWTQFKCSDDTNAWFFTNDDGSATPSDTSGDRYLMMVKAGIYSWQATGYFEAACTGGYLSLEGSGQQVVVGVHPDNDWATALTITGSQEWMNDQAIVGLTGTSLPADLVVRVFNQDVADRALKKAYMMVTYTPLNPDNEGSYTRF